MPMRGRGGKAPKAPKNEDGKEEKVRQIPMTEFTVEFAWRETPPAKRTAEDPDAKKAAPVGGQTAPVQPPPAASPAAAPGNPPATPAVPAKTN